MSDVNPNATRHDLMDILASVDEAETKLDASTFGPIVSRCHVEAVSELQTVTNRVLSVIGEVRHSRRSWPSSVPTVVI